jgi:TM2 domain-containing membrane protein YozV
MRRRKTAIILCLFLGWIGVHRFYLGRLISGLIYLLTIGLFGVGWLIDLIALFRGGFAESFIHYTPRLSKLT